MKSATAVALADELLHIINEFPRLDFREYSIEGLTVSEKGLLLMLAMNPGEGNLGPSAAEISHLLKITPGGVTHLLKPLETNGYIERRPEVHDRRVVRIHMTRRGQHAAHLMMAEARKQVVGLLEHLGEKDSRALVDLIARSMDYFSTRPPNIKE
ncbi:MAG: MarR family winged helix-turn-helix transcriptional regulator [Anaerolineales bacterium]